MSPKISILLLVFFGFSTLLVQADTSSGSAYGNILNSCSEPSPMMVGGNEVEEIEDGVQEILGSSVTPESEKVATKNEEGTTTSISFSSRGQRDITQGGLAAPQQQTISYKLQAADTDPNCYITASEYCDFLNDTALTDLDNVYNEKMEEDLASECITRAGVLGSYQYEVIDEKEDEVIAFVSKIDIDKYCKWLSDKSAENAATTSNFNYTVDQQLKSNHLNFQLINARVASDLAKTSSGGGDKDTSWEEEVAGIATGIGMILGDREESPAEGALGDGAIRAPVEAKGKITSAVGTELSQTTSGKGRHGTFSTTKPACLEHSPLMMFSEGDEEETKKTDSRIDSQAQDSRFTTTPNSISSGSADRSTGPLKVQETGDTSDSQSDNSLGISNGNRNDIITTPPRALLTKLSATDSPGSGTTEGLSSLSSSSGGRESFLQFTQRQCNSGYSSNLTSHDSPGSSLGSPYSVSRSQQESLGPAAIGTLVQSTEIDEGANFNITGEPIAYHATPVVDEADIENIDRRRNTFFNPFRSLSSGRFLSIVGNAFRSLTFGTPFGIYTPPR